MEKIGLQPVKTATVVSFKELCLKSRKSFLDRVSTGSGSDLVSDKHAIFPNDFDSHGLTRSLPLPVLTRSKCDLAFEAKPLIVQSSSFSLLSLKRQPKG